MKVTIDHKGDNHMEVMLLGEDHSVPNLLREALMEDESVEFASYNIDHPQLGSPKLVIKTKALKDAIKKAKKMVSEFQAAVEKAKEEKPEKEHKAKKKK
jgi:DNA-directed RNA polymerase subunit L